MKKFQLLQALELWCKTIDKKGNQLQQPPYTGIDGNVYASFTLNKYSFLKGLDCHELYQGFPELTYKVFQKHCEKISKNLKKGTHE